MSILSTFLRSSIVAFRYATTTNSRISQQYKKIFTPNENNREFLGAGWRDVDPE
jgi:hypothetical protein